jgi:putative component of membrane protein insertase Oxa1/YidC/SpoIIIJ protein YidD
MWLGQHSSVTAFELPQIWFIFISHFRCREGKLTSDDCVRFYPNCRSYNIFFLTNTGLNTAHREWLCSIEEKHVRNPHIWFISHFRCREGKLTSDDCVRFYPNCRSYSIFFLTNTGLNTAHREWLCSNEEKHVRNPMLFRLDAFWRVRGSRCLTVNNFPSSGPILS